MKKFEFRVYVTVPGQKSHAVEAALNEFGEAGWRIAGVSRAASRDSDYIYFERELPTNK